MKPERLIGGSLELDLSSFVQRWAQQTLQHPVIRERNQVEGKECYNEFELNGKLARVY